MSRGSALMLRGDVYGSLTHLRLLRGAGSARPSLVRVQCIIWAMNQPAVCEVCGKPVRPEELAAETSGRILHRACAAEEAAKPGRQRRRIGPRFERACPRCGTRFMAVSSHGQCPKCGLVFSSINPEVPEADGVPVQNSPGASESPQAKDELRPRPYTQWPTDPQQRWIVAGNTFGQHVMEHAVGYALEQIDETLSPEAKEAARKAAMDAVYGMMMILDGVPDLRIGEDHRIIYVLTAAVDERGKSAPIETIELAPGGDGLCMGFHGWREQYFGEEVD